MNTHGNTVLITGGASGIGWALARRFANAGSQVIICGRRADQLLVAKQLCPELHTVQCDVSVPAERLSLVKTVTEAFPTLNVVINNAGIQNRFPSLLEPQDWQRHEAELATNLAAPMHLSMLFVPHLRQKPAAAIVNITSGLAFSPLAAMPTYCATKAALHSFTLSLRHQLKTTSIAVIELVPPMVNTDLGGKGLHDQGTPLDEFADHAFAQLEKGELEFGFGFSEISRGASRAQLDQMFANMNR